MIEESLLDNLEFVRQPDIVLITLKHDIATAYPVGAFVSLVLPDMSCGRLNQNREIGTARKCLRDRFRRIGRAIITDDQLIGQASLARQTFELLQQIAFTVIGSK